MAGKKNDSAAKSKDLRNRAEQLLREGLKGLKDRPAEDIQKVIHELQVHQIELEMQNEELRRTQLALHAERDKFSDLYDFAPVGYFTISEKGMITATNLTGAAMLGVARGSLVGKPFSRFITKDTQDVFYQHRKELLKTKNKQPCELRFVKSDGHQFYGQTDCIALFDENGDLEHIRISITDITDRKRAEEALKHAHDDLERRVEKRTAELDKANKQLQEENEDRKRAEEALLEYREAVEGSEELITAVDGQYVYSLANEAFLRYHCLNREQVIGQNIVDVMGKEIFESIIKPKAVHCFKGESVDFEMKYNYPEYGERYMLVSNYPLKNDDGEVTEMVVIARDVTVSKIAAEGLRESEEKYRSLVEATSDWIWEVDNEGVYTYTNSKIKDILGYEPGEILGKTPFDFMVPNDQKRLTEWFRGILESRKPFEGMENTNIHKDGRHVLLETSGVPILAPDGNLLGYRGIEGAGLGLAIVKEIAERHAGKIWMKPRPQKGIAFTVSISKNLQLSH